MPKKGALLLCFSCHKPWISSKWAKRQGQDKNCCNSYTDVPSVTDSSHCHQPAPKVPEGSTKETISLSTTSQTPVFGDATSASLGGWSTVQQADLFDVSKVNLVSSEDSGSIIRPVTGGLSHSSDLTDEFYDRLESLVLRLEFLTGLQNGLSAASDLAGLQAFQSLMDEVLPRYLALSSELGLELKRQSQHVQQAYECVRDLIKLSTVYAKPPISIIEEYYKPLSYKLLEVADFDNHHPEPLCRLQLITVADSALALAWCSSKTASVFVREIREAANAFANKAFQYCYTNHSKDAEWIRSWMACMQGLQNVVDNHFPLGLTWVHNGPKAPAPPKSFLPTLLYGSQRIVRNNLSSSPKRLVGKSDKPLAQDDNVDRTTKLLKEISHTRMHLRHVTIPEFLR